MGVNTTIDTLKVSTRYSPTPLREHIDQTFRKNVTQLKQSTKRTLMAHVKIPHLLLTSRISSIVTGNSVTSFGFTRCQTGEIDTEDVV